MAAEDTIRCSRTETYLEQRPMQGYLRFEKYWPSQLLKLSHIHGKQPIIQTKTEIKTHKLKNVTCEMTGEKCNKHTWGLKLSARVSIKNTTVKDFRLLDGREVSNSINFELPDGRVTPRQIIYKTPFFCIFSMSGSNKRKKKTLTKLSKKTRKKLLFYGRRSLKIAS